jgi:hypothetical protein
MRFPFLLILLVVLEAGCVSMNPYVRVKEKMLHDDDGTIHCWKPITEGCTAECENEKAIPALNVCVDTLRRNVKIFTAEWMAKNELETCMKSKGWDRPWIAGDMRFDY